MKLSRVRNRLTHGLRQRFPSAYEILRPPFRHFMRAVSRLFPIPGYWEQRRDHNYYTAAMRLAKTYAPNGGQVLDVGANDAEVLDELAGFERKVALDIRYILPRRGIQRIQQDFLEYRPDSYFDLVLCLQVLEHLRNPEPFARKLLRTGRVVIISVPYKWPQGLNKNHPQDPVDETKLASWTQREPIETVRVEDKGRERLFAVYRESLSA